MNAVPKPDRRADSRPLDPSNCPDCHAIVGAAVLRTDTCLLPLLTLRPDVEHSETEVCRRQSFLVAVE